MIEPAEPIDAESLASLSRRLGIPARRLLIAAARMADAPERRDDPAFRAEILREARQPDTASDIAALQLLTPTWDYAPDLIENLFAGIWPETARGKC